MPVAGRHVLTELVKDPFIPNDTHMELTAGRIQVLLQLQLQSQKRLTFSVL